MAENLAMGQSVQEEEAGAAEYVPRGQGGQVVSVVLVQADEMEEPAGQTRQEVQEGDKGEDEKVDEGQGEQIVFEEDVQGAET